MKKKFKKGNKTETSSDFLSVVFSLKNKWWLILTLIVITFITFSPSLKNDFVRWDDHQYVTENELIKDISIKNLGKFGENVAGNFHPLTMISLALDYHFFELDPFYYHLKNLIYHLLNTVLVFFFIMKVSKKNIFVSFFTALLFGIHPMHVESVAWVSERKDVLYSFYFLIGLLLYYEYLQNKKIIFYILTFVAFVLSCLSKSAAVVFPVVLLLIDYYENGKLELNQGVQKVPFFIVSLIIGIVALYTQSSSIVLENYSFFNRILYASNGFYIYIIKFLFPINLSHLHPYPIIKDSPLKFYMSVIGILILFFLLIRHREKYKWVLWGFFFYFITIILVLQLIQVGSSFITERYSYMPYIGLGFVFYKFLYFIYYRFPLLRKALLGFIYIKLVSYSILTFSQTKIWANTFTLWSNMIKVYPNESSNAHNSLADYWLMKGDTIRALSEFDKSIELDTSNYMTFSLRGKYYFNIKQYELAVKDFTTVINLKNDHLDALKGRSASFYFLGDIENALIDINKCIEFDSLNYDAFNLQGNIYLRNNEFNLALNSFEKALLLKSDYKDALNNKELVLSILNDSTGTVQLNNIIQNNSDDYITLTNRGIIAYKNRDYVNALSDFNRALEFKNDYPEALRGRSAIYYEQKKYNEAINDISAYLAAVPNNYDMLNRRALCYINTDQPQKAIEDLNKLIAVQPNNGVHYQGRGFMYIKLGNREKALDDMLKANELGMNVDANLLRALHTE